MSEVKPEDLLVTSFTVSGKFVSRTYRGGDTFISMTVSPRSPIPLMDMAAAHAIASKNLYKRLMTDAISKGRISKPDGLNELRLVLSNIDALSNPNKKPEQTKTDSNET